MLILAKVMIMTQQKQFEFFTKKYLVSFLREKRIQLIIWQVSVSFINLSLPAICLHLLWCHGHLTWGWGLHLHGSSPSRCHSTCTNHRSGASHLTCRRLIPPGPPLAARSGCCTRRLSPSSVCSWCLCPARCRMPWSFTFSEKKKLFFWKKLLFVNFGRDPLQLSPSANAAVGSIGKLSQHDTLKHTERGTTRPSPSRCKPHPTRLNFENTWQ